MTEMISVKVHFYSYFKDLTGCPELTETVPTGFTVGDLHQGLMARFPKLAQMEKSTLIAVGVEYQPRGYVIQEGDEISLFPPVQGG